MVSSQTEAVTVNELLISVILVLAEQVCLKQPLKAQYHRTVTLRRFSAIQA